MAYKSLLTTAIDAETDAHVLREAAGLATALDAHLDVLAVGLDRTETGYYYAGSNALLQQELRQQAESDARDVASAAKELLDKTDARWAMEKIVAPIGAVGHAMALHARFSDLVVLGRPYGETMGYERPGMLEATLFDADAPVLVLPPQMPAQTWPRRIIVAWNGSAEAMAAIRAALPMLRQADLVSVTVIDPPQHGPERSDPGGALSQMLSRHGVHAEVSVMAKTMPRISDILCRQVTDTDADLVVMGAYGHSRFRQAILGGATRNMLEISPVPVLMAH